MLLFRFFKVPPGCAVWIMSQHDSLVCIRDFGFNHQQAGTRCSAPFAFALLASSVCITPGRPYAGDNKQHPDTSHYSHTSTSHCSNTSALARKEVIGSGLLAGKCDVTLGAAHQSHTQQGQHTPNNRLEALTRHCAYVLIWAVHEGGS